MKMRCRPTLDVSFRIDFSHFEKKPYVRLARYNGFRFSIQWIGLHFVVQYVHRDFYPDLG